MTMLKAVLGGVMVEFTRCLLPPMCREHVLGDLHERLRLHRSPFRYAVDAAGAIFAAVIGQLLKVTPFPFILLEAILIYASFYVAGSDRRASFARFTRNAADLVCV